MCGGIYHPHRRILTNHAVNKGKITVFGGSQLRPNLHIQDYADLCKLMLVAPDEKIAEVVKKVVQEEFPERGA